MKLFKKGGNMQVNITEGGKKNQLLYNAFMNERILEELENVPDVITDGKDAFALLKSLINNEIELYKLKISMQEWKRINYELKKIKEFDIAKTVLFGRALTCIIPSTRDIPIAIWGVENCSYIHYRLGITNVNSWLYNLPFERFFNHRRKLLTPYCVYVQKGQKVLLLKSIYAKFGKNNILRGKDNENYYYVSSKPINPDLIKKKVVVANLNEEVYEENVSVLTYKELDKLGYYSFSIIEVENIKYMSEEYFSEEQIYQRTREIFNCRIPEISAFTEIAEIRILLEHTEYKLIYQEQLMEILNKLCGIDMTTADHLRREIAKGKKESLSGLRQILIDQYGENGQKLFDYLYKNGRYTISKAYVVANLQNLIEY